jgi:protein-tyrosine phosphatase
MGRGLLVVCVGNICRSPMAQAVLARDLGAAWSVASAGLGALVGEPAAPEAVQALEAKGLSVEGHRARQLSADMVREAELVLVMEQFQKNELEKAHPWARGRVFLLGHWDGIEIADPYRKPREVFDATLELIERGVRGWRGRLA